MDFVILYYIEIRGNGVFISRCTLFIVVWRNRK